MNLFIVTAYKYNDVESHSYIVGVFSSLTLAKAAKEVEEHYRGEKYTCKILPVTLNSIREKDCYNWIED